MGEMKQAQTQNTAQLRSMLLDPAINLVFQRLAREVEEHKDKLKQKQNELSAWKFTPDRCETPPGLVPTLRLLKCGNFCLKAGCGLGQTAIPPDPPPYIYNVRFRNKQDRNPRLHDRVS